MGTKGFKILFHKDEDYLDDPLTLLDFEERTVFCGSEEFLRNITIEDPGDVVSISKEDYEVQQKKSLLQLKELKKLKERNGNLLKKCRSCCIKVVDCHKFPWYYQNKVKATKKSQYPITEHNVVEIEKEDKAEIIIDLTENEVVVCDNQYDNKIQEEYTKNIEKVKANRNGFTSVENAVDGKVRKQPYKRLSKPVLSNNENESHIKVPESKVDQATDLIISTYTRLTDKAIQKLKNKIESKNSKNKSHHLVTNLILGNKSFINNKSNLLKVPKRIEKEAEVSKDNNNNDCDNIHYKRKTNKKCNKIKYIYTSEQISKTKIKLKKNSLKPNVIISIQNQEEIKDKERTLNLNAINREQCESSKKVKIIHNASNEKLQNHCENKQERVQYNSHSYLSESSPVVTEIITENENSTPLPSQNIGLDRFHGCNQTLISADRIIPHFHENAFLNHSDTLSKAKSNTKYPKRPKETVHIYETKRNRTTFDSTEALNTGPIESQIPNIEKNNTMANNRESHKKIYNANAEVPNNSANDFVRTSQVTYNLPVNNRILSKTSTHISSDVVKEDVNNLVFMRHSKKYAAQLEDERLRYLLPSNLRYYHIQNILKKKCNCSFNNYTIERSNDHALRF